VRKHCSIGLVTHSAPSVDSQRHIIKSNQLRERSPRAQFVAQALGLGHKELVEDVVRS